MSEPRNEHQKALEDIDRLLAEAKDETTRRELESLRDRLNQPALRAMAREAAGQRDRPRGNLMLEFHDPMLPGVVTAIGTVASAAVCLFAVVTAFQDGIPRFVGVVFDPWLVASFAGAVSVSFTALSLVRTFSVRFDTEGMTSRASGSRWARLRVGTMRWEEIRSLNERPDRVLEVRAEAGKVLDIPMRVANYSILHQHLSNMVMLYGERGG